MLWIESEAHYQAKESLQGATLNRTNCLPKLLNP